MLGSYDLSLGSPGNAVVFLSRLKPRELHDGFIVPEEYRLPVNYHPVYKRLGLVPASDKKR